MRLLFDTHLVIWALEGSERLPREARALMQQDVHEHFVSVVSVWEISLKVRLGKLALSAPMSELEALLAKAGFRSVPVVTRHALRIAEDGSELRDPFDLLLLAQCEEESLRLVSADKALRNSPWVIAV
jgi:PIN domain nuclease of toxin-antitoxin system